MPRINVDFRLLDARAELPALRDSVRTLEEQLEYLAAKRRQQVLGDLQELENSADEADVQLAFQELRYEVEYTYPRVYRGALLVVIWAAYESAVLQVADFVRRQKNISLTLSNVRGRGTLEQAQRYFPDVLAFDLFSTADSLSRIRPVNLLRNTFAHAGGRVASLSDRARRTVRTLERVGWVEEELGYLVPTKAGLEGVLKVVDTETSSLIRRALEWSDERSATDQATAS